jgi:dihydroxyacetone kinase
MNTSDEINLKSSLLGFCAFNKDIVLYSDHGIAIRNDEDFIENKSRVMIISGGGSGHEPSQIGFVGRGMVSAAVCGNVFTSPSVMRLVGISENFICEKIA